MLTNSVGGEKQMVEQPTKEYQNKVLFMHKNKKSEDSEEGKYLFIFNNDEKTLGGGVKSLLMNTSDVKELIEGSAVVESTGKSRYVKVSIMRPS